MIQRILKGYLGIFAALARFAVLGVACVAVGLAVVYPLWLLATVRPVVYTLVCAVLLVAVLTAIFASRIKTAYRLNPARFRRGILKFAVLAVGLACSIALVLAWHRFLGLVALLVTAAVWGVLAFTPTASAPSETQ